MKILVVGATGYIGSATARALRQDGHAVTGLARSEASAARLHAEGLRSQPGDFRDPPSLAAAVEAQDPDIVVVIASAGGGSATPTPSAPTATRCRLSPRRWPGEAGR